MMDERQKARSANGARRECDDTSASLLTRLRKTLLQEYGFRRERLSVLSDDADFFSVKARELDGLPEEGIFIILVVGRERILMDNYQVGAVATGAGEVGQQALNLRRKSRLLFQQPFVSCVRH